MADLTAAGAQLYIGGAEVDNPDTYDFEDDYRSVTWTAVGGIQNLGEVGDSRRIAEYTELSGERVKRLPTFKDGGTMNVSVTLRPGDAGQAAIVAAIGKSYPYKVVLRDGETSYFIGINSGDRRNFGDGSGVVTRSVPLQVNSEFVEQMLSNPLASATGATSADASVVTNRANGTLYWVVTTSATAPSVTQIKAGQNEGGTAAAADGSASVTTAGTQSISVTGLTTATTYYFYALQSVTDGDGIIVAASAFTTD